MPAASQSPTASSGIQRNLALTQRLAYAAPAFALALVGIPIYVYVPKFYSDTVGIDIGVMGALLFGVRLFDAVTDPVMGFLSDRTRSRFGRRRPYLLIASVFVALCVLMLFNPPLNASGPTALLWFGFSIYALFLFWTAVVVPYESLGLELTFDYNERTALFGLRDGFLIAGTLAAAASPALVQRLFGLPDTAAGEREKFFSIAVLYAPLLMGTCWWCALALREARIQPAPAPRNLASELTDVLRNRPFLILLGAYAISALGSNLPATLILYYVEYVLESPLAELFLLLYFVTGIAFLPAWVALARRVGKKPAWLAAMAVNTGAFAGVLFLGPGDEVVYGALVVLSGIGFGAALALPSSLQADVIDYDELLSGERREGTYVGLWNIFKKMAAAAGVGAGLAALGLAGYAPNTAQSPQVVFALKLLYAGVPCLCNAAAFLVAMAYPIDGAVHRQIRSAIARRRGGQSVADPLRAGRTLEPPAELCSAGCGQRR